MRSYDAFDRTAVLTVFQHPVALPHAIIAERIAMELALTNYASGLDFADALHHATYRQCDSMASFDDKKFKKRTQRLGLSPSVIVPK